MTTPDQLKKASDVLDLAKRLDRRMTNRDDEMVAAWAGALFAHSNWPRTMLKRAVSEFYADTHDERITVGAIIARCRKIFADQIGRETQAERDRRLFEQDRRLGLDTTWYQPNREVRETPPEAASAARALGERWSPS